MKPWMYQALKMVVGAFIATIICDFLQLDYSVTAGIIVILSIQPTKRLSLNNAVKRVTASLIGLAIVTGIMALFGHTLWMFILSLILFIPIAFLLKVEDGIVLASVLMSHVLVQESILYALNAVYILFVGVGIALLVNLYMPNEKRVIEKEIEAIDEALRQQLRKVVEQEGSHKLLFASIDQLIEKAIARIQRDSQNRLLRVADLNIHYVTMRREQIYHLKQIDDDLARVKKTQFKEPIEQFLLDVSNAIGKVNMAAPLRIKLNSLRDFYKTTKLPETREEFEERAILFHILYDIEAFLQAKIRYHELHGNER
ncbi:MAG: aromatic acid exporter family protein [Methanomicrobia archaeon]|nr:aromatic acid exporter family protein [Methanomicrobia archaeon]